MGKKKFCCEKIAQAKLVILFIIYTTYCFSNEVKSSEVLTENRIQIPPNKVFYMQFHSKDNKASKISFFLTEQSTKKKASIQLNKIKDTQLYGGFFIVNFNMNEANQSFEVDLKNKQKLHIFQYEKNDGNGSPSKTNMVIFENKNEINDFVFKHKKQMEQLVEVNRKIELERIKAQNEKLAAEAALNLKKVTNKLDAKDKVETVIRLKDRKQEEARVSIELQEALKLEKLREEQQKKTKQEIENNKKIADQKIKQANFFYDKEKYAEASKLYQEATILDPENDSYLYKYAVTMYKLGNYNESLSLLSLSEGGEQNPIEHRYYVALNFLKLKEYDKSISEFNEVRDENDRKLSPAAAFFAGNLEMQKEKYKEAKVNFQYVLDNSSDPIIDKQAEQKIEEIDRIESFLESQKEIVKYSFFVGPTYDGNVLNIATQNLATKSEAYRMQYGGNLSYFYYRSLGTVLSLDVSLSDMYSVDNEFKSNADIQAADPLLMGFKLPIKLDRVISNNSFNFVIAPAYSSLLMSEVGGSRKPILYTNSLNTEMNWSSSKVWLHGVKLDYFVDSSKLEVSSEDDDQSASRLGVTYSLSKIINESGDKLIGADLAYNKNSAKGKNNNFTKMILGVNYFFPIKKSYTGNTRIEYTDLVYPDNSSSRKDSIASFTIGGSHDYSKSKNLSLNLIYSLNNSNLESYKYNKFMLSFLFTYTGNYLKK